MERALGEPSPHAIIKNSMKTQLTPTTEKQRYIILDALRGLALLGICLANLPEFALWTFLTPNE